MILSSIQRLRISKNVSDTDKNQLYSDIIGYALSITSKGKVGRSAKKCGVFEKVLKLNDTFRKSPYVQSDFWRAIYSAVNRKCCNCVYHKFCKDIVDCNSCDDFLQNTKVISNTFNIKEIDIKFTLSLLTNDAIKKINKRFGKRPLVNNNFPID